MARFDGVSSAPQALPAVAIGLAAALVVSVVPWGGALPLEGVWLFPHAHQSDVLGGSLDSAFYIADNDSAVLADSFYADSQADSAHIQVDLYNIGGGTQPGVQLFAAISDVTLWTSMSFSGGESGVVTYDSADSLSAGTPSGMDTHDVYPAYFASYGIGDLGAGTSGIATVWVNVSGDFAGGLIIHLDWESVDGSGNTIIGPFEADMNIFEAGGAVACSSASGTFSRGPAQGTGFWKEQYDKTTKGKGHTAFSTDNLTALLQAVAADSDFFTYASWGGTTPSGDADCGSVDIDSFSEAVDVLKAHGEPSVSSNKLERAALALWLNVASGKVSLDGTLAVNTSAKDGNSTRFAKETGLSQPGTAYDTAREILAFAEGLLLEGSSASAADLNLAKALCESVNEAWLIPA